MTNTFAKFKSVSFKNVLVFKDEYEIPLSNQGVVSVIGINKDTGGSNGAGKSTVFDILRAIHLGKVADGTPDIQFLSNKGSSFINYIASYGNNRYNITKYRNDKVYKNNTIILKNDKPIGAKKNAVALRKEISEDYIKLSEAVWDNCVVLRTDKAHTLLQGTPSERIEFISNICQLNAYDDIEERLKDNLKKVSTEIDGLRETQALYADVSRSIGESASKKELEDELTKLRSKKESLSELVSKAIKNKDSYSKKASKVSSLLKEVLSIEKYHYIGDYKKANEDLEHNKEKLGSIRKKIESLKSSLSLYEQYKSLKDKLNKLNVPSKSADYYENKLESLIKENKRIYKDLDKAKEAQSLKKFLDSSKQYDLDSLKKKLTKCHTEKTRYDLLSKLIGHKYDKCPLCEQVLSKEIDIDEEQLDKDKQDVLSRMQRLSDKIEYTKDLLAKKQRYSEIKHLNYPELKEQYSNNENKIKEFQQALSLKEKEKSYKETLSELKGKIQNIDTDHIQEDLDRYSTKCDGISSTIQDLTTLKVSLKRINDIEKELDISSNDAEQELEKYLSLVEKFDTIYEEKNIKLKKVIQKIGEYKNSLETVSNLLDRKEKYEKDLAVLPKLEKKKKFLDALVYCYSNKGLKANKISKILEALSIRLKEYTSILFSEKDIDFEVTATSNSFSMMCVRKDSKGNIISKYDAKRLSSGERARFTLSLVFALDDITSPNQRCNFKVLDEVDAKLDEKGKRILLERFIPILKSKCDTLFIVSHDKEVRDSNIFDKKLVITKKDAKSTLKMFEVKHV